MSKPRTPAPTKLSRAAKDMHSGSAKVRKEAAEVMALAPRRPRKGPSKK